MQFRVSAARQLLVVPWADLLADIAAGDPGAEGTGDLIGKFGFSIFDRVIRDASAGINDEGFRDGLCRTGIQTGPAATAEAASWLIRFKIQVGEQVADHQPRSLVAADEVAVFSDPAQTGFLSPGLVQQRCGVNTGAPTAVGPLFRKPTTDPSQPLIHNPVIVTPQP